MNNLDFLTSELKLKGIILDPLTVGKLLKFTDLLLEANKTFNLTAITNNEEIIIKHLLDSLLITCFPEYSSALQILDIGSGAGIPAIPLAIASPSKSILSIDSTQKKIYFQHNSTQALQLTNFLARWGRAEDLGKLPELREKFSIVTARAVAAINILVELALPFVQVGSYAILYKSKEYQIELQAAEKAIATLGGVVHRIVETELPNNFGYRSFIIIKKVKPTPISYPRQAGALKKKPL